MMGYSSSKATSLFLLFNLILFTYASSNSVPCPPSATPVHGPPKCPTDTLKFGVCGSWLGLLKEVVGTKPSKECCTLVKGLADLEAAACLCTAINANVLGVGNLQVPVAISLLLNGCGKKIPEGFTCK